MDKAIQRDSSPSNMVMRAKLPSDAWTLLKRATARDNSADIEQLAMIVREFAREYVPRAKGLAAAIRYNGVCSGYR